MTVIPASPTNENTPSPQQEEEEVEEEDRKKKESKNILTSLVPKLNSSTAKNTKTLHDHVTVNMNHAASENTLTVHRSAAVYHDKSAYFNNDTHTNDQAHAHEHVVAQLKEGFDVAHFDFNDPSSLTEYFCATGIAKAHSPIWQRFYSGLIAGMFVTIGAAFALVAAGGIDPTVRAANPAIPKLLVGATFPIGLALIMLVGGDLFTGDCMYVGIAWFSGRMSLWKVFNALFVSFFSNLCGCLFFSYILIKETNILAAEPYHSFILSVAAGKMSETWVHIFLRAVGANIMVCVAVFMGATSRDALGRCILAWAPITAFSVIGFEHVIANMSFIPSALMYGAPYSVQDYITNSMVPSAIGNFIGGFVVVGGSCAYMYSWRKGTFDSFGSWLRFQLVPSKSLGDILSEVKEQFFNAIPFEKLE